LKKVLITGANSYIGTSVEKYILKHYPEECSFEAISLRDEGWKDKSFSDYDVIFHVAGIAHQKENKYNAESYFKINRDLLVEVAEKAKNEGVKHFVFLSSMSVYGLLKGRISPNTKLKPKTAYGKSKLQAEQRLFELSDDHFKACVIRPPMIYGKGCKGNYSALRNYALKLKFFPYVKNERSMLYIENFCEFVRLMILNEGIGIFFPQNREYSNTSEMVREIASVHGKKMRLLHGFGWLIKILQIFVPKLKKAFGSLTYSYTMSEYRTEYNVVGFKDSIIHTEKKSIE
jgi:UDP-glucose 4-epimerase